MSAESIKKSSLEKSLLTKLKKGVLDGSVGVLMVYKGFSNVVCGKVIEAGVPIAFRKGKKTIETRFNTDEEKLDFLKRYGWLMDDEEAKTYSNLFK